MSDAKFTDSVLVVLSLPHAGRFRVDEMPWSTYRCVHDWNASRRSMESMSFANV
jgi:hypothetical protein